MSGFTDSALEKKLAELNCSQQSIQTLSLWLIHHRKHHKAIVRVWYKELFKADPKRKLTFMYVANDVIQNSKKKGPEFSREFKEYLTKSFAHVFASVSSDDKTKMGLEKIIRVFEDRLVYDSDFIAGLRATMNSKSPRAASAKKPSRTEKFKKKKTSGAPTLGSPGVKRPRQRGQSRLSEKEAPKRKIPKEEVVMPPSPHGEPPEVEDLIKAIQDLDNSPSTDAVVREKIAQFPPEVSDVTLLDKIQNKAAADRLRAQVEEASCLLTEYNARLNSELEDRRTLSRMLHDFTHAQRALLMNAERKLEDFQAQLQRVSLVRSELKSHLQNLPDLTLLPSVTGGLAPLPSAGDLFQ